MNKTVAVGSSLLVLIFAYTALSKLAALPTFRYMLGQVPFIGKGAAALSVLLPLTELVVVLLLLFPATRLQGFYASAGLLSLFLVYLTYMLLVAPEKPCSCGGVINGMGWWEHVGMNVFLIGVAVMGIHKTKASG